jgi:hypothetical protein
LDARAGPLARGITDLAFETAKSVRETVMLVAKTPHDSRRKTALNLHIPGYRRRFCMFWGRFHREPAIWRPHSDR